MSVGARQKDGACVKSPRSSSLNLFGVGGCVILRKRKAYVSTRKGGRNGGKKSGPAGNNSSLWMIKETGNMSFKACLRIGFLLFYCGNTRKKQILCNINKKHISFSLAIRAVLC